VDRWACLNVRAFPLQLLLTEHPDWEGHPIVVVDRDAPNGLVTWMSRRAESKGIRIGIRYAAALGLCSDIRASVVPDETVRAGIGGLVKRLRRYTPDTEPSQETPGVFWLNAGGLTGLYDDERTWARTIIAELREIGFRASFSVGATRFGTYAVSTTRRGITVFDDPADEEQAALSVLLSRLDLPPKTVETLELLGIRTVEEFLSLPMNGIRRRFGDEAAALHRRASGDMWTPLQAERSVPPLFERTELDTPEADHTRLLALMTKMLKPLLGRLMQKGDTCDEVLWAFILDHGEQHRDSVKPATPTADIVQLSDLMRLRIENTQLSEGAMTVVVVVKPVPADTGQETLFSTRTRRDIGAANRALARLRAEFGTDAVVTAELRDAHLPEARFSWQPLRTLPFPALKAKGARFSPLIRRIYDRSEPLEDAEVNEFADAGGPHMISGGWWLRDSDQDDSGGVSREYHFALNAEGRLLWMYYDHQRERWYAQGEVE
jgi:protein ImuB